MSITTLPRMTEAPHLQFTTNTSRDYADVLGYTVALSGDNKIADECRLFEICVEAGVRPFQTEVVERYMRRKQSGPTPPWFRVVCLVGALVGVIGIGIACVATRTMALSLFCFALLPLMFFSIWGAGKSRHWRKSSLSEYRKPIPTAVLDIAVRVCRASPDVQFEVHDLIVEQRIADPFLSIRLGQAIYYIAVWDEPAFDAAYD